MSGESGVQHCDREIWEVFHFSSQFDVLIFIPLLSSETRFIDNLTKNNQIVKHQTQKYGRGII